MNRNYTRLSDKIAELEFEHFQLTLNFNREFALVSERGHVSAKLGEYSKQIAGIEKELDRLHFAVCCKIVKAETFNFSILN